MRWVTLSLLTIHSEDPAGHAEIITGHGAIAQRLAQIGVRFERWVTHRDSSPEDTQEAILEMYREPVRHLTELYGFQSVDVVSVEPRHPQKDELRRKFLQEHIHGDFEVRFFVQGRGLFFLHPSDNAVYGVLCEQGDLISVPANVKHWFDMGEFPAFKCLRLFTRPDGWVAEFTGSDIAVKFALLEQFVSNYGTGASAVIEAG